MDISDWRTRIYTLDQVIIDLLNQIVPALVQFVDFAFDTGYVFSCGVWGKLCRPAQSNCL